MPSPTISTKRRRVYRRVRAAAALVALTGLVAACVPAPQVSEIPPFANPNPPGILSGAPSWRGWDIARSAALTADGGYVLDGFGGLHRLGNAPAVAGAPYWRGWDIVRGVTLSSAGDGYVLDGYGGLHRLGNAPAVAGAPYWRGWDIARGVALSPTGGGYVLDGYGGIHRFRVGSSGLPPVLGGPYWRGWDIARDLVVTPSGAGAYLLDGYGGIHRLGDAAPVTGAPYWWGWDFARGITLTADGTGGYVLDAWGGLHGFGIGNHPAPPDRAGVGGVWVPSNQKVAPWRPATQVVASKSAWDARRAGTAWYGAGNPSRSDRCSRADGPLANPQPGSPTQENQCLIWYRPDPARFPGPRPTILFTHGGSWIAGVADPPELPILDYLERGWTVVSVQYRFVGSSCAVNQFPTPVRDVQDALAYTKDHAATMGVDPARIVMIGHSAGAHLTETAATGWNDRTGMLRTGAKYRPAGWVAHSGIEDMAYLARHSAWAFLVNFFMPPARPGGNRCSGPRDDTALRAASASYQLDSADPPGFIIHGSADVVTPPGYAGLAMGAAMASVGRENAIWVQTVPGDAHSARWNPTYLDAFLAGAITGTDPAPPR